MFHVIRSSYFFPIDIKNTIFLNWKYLKQFISRELLFHIQLMLCLNVAVLVNIHVPYDHDHDFLTIIHRNKRCKHKESKRIKNAIGLSSIY